MVEGESKSERKTNNKSGGRRESLATTGPTRSGAGASRRRTVLPALALLGAPLAQSNRASPAPSHAMLPPLSQMGPYDRTMTAPDELYFPAQATNSYFLVNAERARGRLPEKESTKAAATIVRHNLPDAASFVDAGCSAGHLLRSLLSADLPVQRYVGIDLDAPAIELARSIYAAEWAGDAAFEVASVTELPIGDKTVDVSISLNVLEHMKSPVITLSELIRVTRHLIVLRTSVTDRTYIIQEVRNSKLWAGPNATYVPLPEPADELAPDGKPHKFVYQNMWGQDYLEAQIKGLEADCNVLISEDTLFSAEAIREDNELTGLPNAAVATGNQQIVGPLILPHCWVLIGLDGLRPSMP